jgi:hypothetical protein
MQPITNGVIVVDFLLNQDYIKEFLCINKDKPKLSCNGKCQLTKQLKQTQNEGQNKFPHLINLEYEFVTNTIITIPQRHKFILKAKLNAMYANIYDKNFAIDIFHPPQA